MHFKIRTDNILSGHIGFLGISYKYTLKKADVISYLVMLLKEHIKYQISLVSLISLFYKES